MNYEKIRDQLFHISQEICLGYERCCSDCPMFEIDPVNYCIIESAYERMARRAEWEKRKEKESGK